MVWNVLHACTGVDHPVSQPCLLGSGMICRLLEGLATRQALQRPSDQDVLCAVTCCPLEAVLSCALVHHAATSSHGADHIGYKRTLNPNMYVTLIVLHRNIYDYVCQAAGGFAPTASCIN